MDADLVNSISLLSDGFKALSDEYKALAARHQLVESKLAAALQEVRHHLAWLLHISAPLPSPDELLLALDL